MFYSKTILKVSIKQFNFTEKKRLNRKKKFKNFSLEKLKTKSFPCLFSGRYSSTNFKHKLNRQMFKRKALNGSITGICKSKK